MVLGNKKGITDLVAMMDAGYPSIQSLAVSTRYV